MTVMAIESARSAVPAFPTLAPLAPLAIFIAEGEDLNFGHAPR
jgi:hypothetical protein